MDLSVSAVVLCGGRGRRLGGVDKAFITTPQGRPLWRQLTEAVSPFVEEVLLVMRESQGAHFDDLLRQEGPFSDSRSVLRLVFDPGVGPAQAVLTAANNAGGEALLVLGVDHPHVDDELIRELLKAWTSKTDAVAVQRMKQDQRRPHPEPLWALYRRSAVLQQSHLDWSHRALKDLLGALKPALLERDSPAFENINQISDLNAFGCAIPKSSA